MNGSGKLVKEMVVPHVQRQLLVLKNLLVWPLPLCTDVLHSHNLYSTPVLELQNDKAQAARDLMAISPTKRAGSRLLMPSPRAPSLPQTQRCSLSQGAFQSVHRSSLTPSDFSPLSLPPSPVLQGREKHLPLG